MGWRREAGGEGRIGRRLGSVQATGENQHFPDMMGRWLTAVRRWHGLKPDKGFVAIMEPYREDGAAIDRHRGIGIRRISSGAAGLAPDGCLHPHPAGTRLWADTRWQRAVGSRAAPPEWPLLFRGRL